MQKRVKIFYISGGPKIHPLQLNTTSRFLNEVHEKILWLGVVEFLIGKVLVRMLNTISAKEIHQAQAFAE